MGIILELLVFAAVIAILWWAYTQLALPRPFQIIAVVFIAILAIYFLLSLVGGVPSLGAGLHLRTLG